MLALVTGASSGIGLQYATQLARDYHCDLLLVSNQEKELEQVAKDLAAQYNVKTIARFADLSLPDAAETLHDWCVENKYVVDILVNNAGITRDGLLMRMKDEDFDAVIATNLRSVFLCTRAVARTMMGKRTGRIVNISSINALHGQAGQANYAAAKAGIIGMTRSNAMEFASRGITVNAIAPGFIGTDMTAAMDDATKEKYAAQIPLGRIGKPEDVANAVAFLASDDACYITGQILGVDGGLNA